MQYGLIGKSLRHSFSKNYFEKKFRDLNLEDSTYQNFELKKISEFNDLINKNTGLRGLNVTTPYKESIIPFLHKIDSEAKEIGAVNCINIKNNILYGYNTDVYGFAQSIKPFLEPKHHRALILGSGGAAKAVSFALKKMGIEVFFVSRKKKENQSFFLSRDINKEIIRSILFIINCTPIGMYPKVDQYPELPYESIGENHFCYDLIYNPEESLFLKKSREQGAFTMNGLSMLKLQAEKSWEIWNS